MSRLDLSGNVSDTRIPAYDDLYPDGWAGDRQAERRHRDDVQKIYNWPTDDKNMVGYTLYRQAEVKHRDDVQKIVNWPTDDKNMVGYTLYKLDEVKYT